MKKTVLTVIMLSFLSTACFAQLLKGPAKATPKRENAPMSSSEISGKVKSVSAGDMAKHMPGSIVITDSTGHESTFAVMSTTMVIKDGKKMTLDKVTQNANVRIKYMENKGAKAALGIQIVG